MSVLDESSVEPVGRFVLVRRDPIKEETGGGIVLPDSAREVMATRGRTGVVLKLGQGRCSARLERSGRDGHGPRFPFQVRVGDRVHFGRYGGMAPTDDEDLLLIPEEEILACEEVRCDNYFRR